MKRVKKITIVGGGTAGWMAAAFFSNPHAAKDCHYEITLIDKTDPERIGVGEATLLNFPNFMACMGYQVDDWMPKVDATWKAGIHFPGWGKEGSDIWHPFAFSIVNGGPYGMQGQNNNLTTYDVWTKYQDEIKLNHIQACYRTAMENKVEFDHLPTVYAQQIDCGKLVKFFMDDLKDKIRYIQSDVQSISWDERGEIEYLTLEDESEIESDLYIDCTGFKQLLSYLDDNTFTSDRLYVDTALAGKVEYEDRSKEMFPYTRCEAVSDGWIWTIPTRSRMGTGYVFNRSVSNPDEVRLKMCEYWDNRISPNELREIDWTPYVKDNHFDGNVVSIGLSGGFIEPLESTGLALMIRGIEYLSEALIGNRYEDVDKEVYNVKMHGLYDDCINFVNMHYAYSEREGKFWDYVRDKYIKSDMFTYMEEEVYNPTTSTWAGQKYGFFGGLNWQSWIHQLNPQRVPENTLINEFHDSDFQNHLRDYDRYYRESVSHSSTLVV
mgnify:FL=1